MMLPIQAPGCISESQKSDNERPTDSKANIDQAIEQREVVRGQDIGSFLAFLAWLPFSKLLIEWSHRLSRVEPLLIEGIVKS